MYRYVDKKKLLPIATFDIETTLIGKGDLTFLDSCVYYGGNSDDEWYYHHFTQASDLAAYFFEHPGFRYYAHNGAGFDFSFLLEEIIIQTRKRGYELDPIKQGESRLIGLIVREKSKTILELRDSFALIPLSLKEATAIYATTQKEGIGLEDGVTYNPDKPAHRAYLHSDVRGLFEVLQTFEKLVFDLFGTPISYSAGGTAISAWRANIPDGHAYYRLNERAENFARQGYYGGYVYPGKDIAIHEDAVTLDYNGAYAGQMRKGVPCGACWFTREFVPDRPGIYMVVATVPTDIRHTCIPCKDKHFLRWPTGTFTTTVTSLEIAFAEKHGCRFEILEGIVWEKLEYPFNEFLEKCERFELVDGGRNKATAKQMRNSLYGKFGTRSVVEQCHIALDNNIPWGTEENQLHVRLVFDPKSEYPLPYLYNTVEENTSDYIMPHWAAWITASQRITLIETMYKIDNVYYGDTDSIVCDRADFHGAEERGILIMGATYGTLKLEKEWDTFTSKGPKNYGGKLKSGTFHGKTKGIPRRLLQEEYFYTYDPFDPPEVEFTSVRSAYMTLLHPEQPLSQKRKRKLSSLVNSTGWKLQGEKIVPLHMKQSTLQLRYETDVYAS